MKACLEMIMKDKQQIQQAKPLIVAMLQKKEEVLLPQTFWVTF